MSQQIIIAIQYGMPVEVSGLYPGQLLRIINYDAPEYLSEGDPSLDFDSEGHKRSVLDYGEKGGEDEALVHAISVLCAIERNIDALVVKLREARDGYAGEMMGPR